MSYQALKCGISSRGTIILASLVLSLVGIPIDASETSALGSKIKWLMYLYPNTDFKRTAQEYIKIIAPDTYELSVGQGNTGLQKLVTQKFEDNEIFRQMAISFYRDVAQYWGIRLRGPADDLPFDYPNKCRDDGQGEGPFLISYQCEKNLPRTLLNETTEAGPNSSFKNGWLWDLAMRHSKGNPNIAVDLIGLCGHDNRFQGSKKYIDPTTKETKYLNCPPGGSPFYLPGSLPKADISDILKARIHRIQNPDGSKKIPAKYYHVLGEAFVSCQLVAKGHEAKNIVAAAKFAAHAYRGLNLCETTRQFYGLNEILRFWTWEAHLGRKSLEEFVEEKVDSCLTDHPISECREINPHIDHSTWSSSSKNERHSFLRNLIGRADASELYSKWFLPCSGIQFRGQRNLYESGNSVFKFRPMGWTQSRYELAIYILSTWKIDLEWTVSQHEVGARFATEFCQLKK